jgi:hypothetical protein
VVALALAGSQEASTNSVSARRLLASLTFEPMQPPAQSPTSPLAHPPQHAE